MEKRKEGRKEESGKEKKKGVRKRGRVIENVRKEIIKKRRDRKKKKLQE